MEVIRADHAGACYGVQRALDMAAAALAKDGHVCTLGPLIHNPLVVDDLAQRGAQVVEDVSSIPGGTAVIRSHGITPQERERLGHRADRIVDATCPHVARAQKAAEKLADIGCVIVVGEPGHPEVASLREYACCAGADVHVAPRADALPDHLPAEVGVVVQTTQRAEVLASVVSELERRGVRCIVKDTICSATSERQAAAERLASQVDAMVVIGGRNSSNTTRLTEICAQHCPRTYHVESACELAPNLFVGCRTVGVTAGASTPEYQIADVVRTLQER